MKSHKEMMMTARKELGSNQLRGFLVCMTLVTFLSTLAPEVESIRMSSKTKDTLFNDTDPVANLNSGNFDQIFSKSHSYLIVFYASWCGHCQNFAPKFKQLASDIILWKDVIRLGAVNCADPKNLELCREQMVISYPYVKFFGVNIKKGDTGIEFDLTQGSDAGIMRKVLIHTLYEYQTSLLKGNDSSSIEIVNSHWPDLRPVNASSRRDLMLKIPQLFSGKPVVVVLEPLDSDVGIQVTLDLSSYQKNMPIHRIVSDFNQNLLFELGLQQSSSRSSGRLSLPILIRLRKKEPHDYPDVEILDMSDSDGSKEGETSESSASADSGGAEASESSSSAPSADETKKSREEMMRGKFVSRLSLDLGDKWIPAQDIVISTPISKHSSSASSQLTPVYMVDLYNAIRYSLYHEVLLHQTLNATQVDVLENYLMILHKYFPFDNENPRRFIKRMAQWMGGKRNSTDAWNLHAIMRAGSEGYLPPLQPYVGCKGSRPDLRGYPCALWLLFHTLTVSELTNGKNSRQSEIRDYHSVLFAMRDYVKYFFTCRYCSEEFARLSSKLESELKYSNSSVLWLWAVHNVVNARTARIELSDPEHPKVQFPTIEMCPECHKTGGSSEWNEGAVMKFLTNHYHKANLLRSTSSASATYSSASSLFLTRSYLFFLIIPSLQRLISIIISNKR